MDKKWGNGVSSAPTSGKAESTEHKEAKLLEAFLSIPSIEKAWSNPPLPGDGGFDVTVAMTQTNLSANVKRRFMSTVHISDGKLGKAPNYRWSPFSFEISEAALIVPSPSGSKLLIVRQESVNVKDNTSPTKLEIWGPAQLLQELHVPASVHGSIYADEWFQGVSWSQDEELVAYVAEEPACIGPVFGQNAFSSGESNTNTFGAGTWKGQGDWMEDWGETYSRKRRPVLFVANVISGAVQVVDGIPKDMSAGQVVWAPVMATPSSKSTEKRGTQCLVFVGWSSFANNFRTPRKLGMTYCYNRPCHLYAVEAPVPGRASSEPSTGAIKLTEDITSALFPRFSPNGKLLVFLSFQAAVNSGAHCATSSLSSIHWPADGDLGVHVQVQDVVAVVQHAGKDGFPGLYCEDLLTNPWLPDSSTLLLTSVWRSHEVILAINVESRNVLKVSPSTSTCSWKLLALQSSSLIAVSSSPSEPDNLKLGSLMKTGKDWSWSDISISSIKFTEEVEASLKAMNHKILQIPVPSTDSVTNLAEGSKQSFEAIFVSGSTNLDTKSTYGENGALKRVLPLVVVLHGGPHSVTHTRFSKTAAFLSALGLNLLHVNYRGSLGFGEETLQSLLGNVGQQDVEDVLAALDQVVDSGLADPDKVSVLGGSHGGFLALHLLGQAPDRFRTGVLRSPACNLASMVGTSDIPDWCYVEAFGNKALTIYTEAPSLHDLSVLYQCSPIAHIFKVKVPTLFIMGAQDRRVPVSNGLQCAQALRARGLETKIIMFPDQHSMERPQTEFEGYLNVGLWLKRFM